MTKKIIALLLSITVLSAAMGFNVTAATGAKTARLNNATVSFNGVEKVVQCYNIDNYNFVRIRDVATPFDICVRAMVSEGKQTGVKILSYMPYEGGEALENLTEKSINITVKKEYLYYDSIATEVETFYYKGRNYYKLADIAMACANSLEQAKETAVRDGNYIKKELWEYNTFRTISVQWNPDTKVIECNSTPFDLNLLAKDTRAIALVENTPVINDAEQARIQELFVPRFFEIGEMVYLHDPLPPMIEPPQDGVILAKILKDPSRGAYWNGDSTKGWLGSNITDNYLTYGLFGECTWYAIGRFAEVNGINLKALPNSLIYEPEQMVKGNGQLLVFSSEFLSAPSRSVIVWNGHVAFIEYVERDANGSIEAVYISEANVGTGGVYTYEQDGMIRKHTYEQFMNRAKGFIGYILLK